MTKDRFEALRRCCVLGALAFGAAACGDDDDRGASGGEQRRLAPTKADIPRGQAGRQS